MSLKHFSEEPAGRLSESLRGQYRVELKEPEDNYEEYFAGQTSMEETEETEETVLACLRGYTEDYVPEYEVAKDYYIAQCTMKI